MNTYKITITFQARSLTIQTLRWVVRLYSDRDAPAGVRVRFERVDDDVT